MLLDFRNSKFSQTLTQMEIFLVKINIFTNSKPKFICENPRETLIFTNFEPRTVCENSKQKVFFFWNCEYQGALQ